MKINRSLLEEGKVKEFNEDVDLSYYEGDPYHIRKINSCHLLLKATNYEDLLSLSFKISGEVLTTCAYTLEEIPYQYDIKEEITLTGSDEDEFLLKGDIIDIDEMLITLIVMNVPMKVIKKGAKLPENGDGYRFISEEDKEKERKNNRFPILDTLEFDDE